MSTNPPSYGSKFPLSQPQAEYRAERCQRLFLKGPIPMAWLRAAKQAGSPAFAVGVTLWFQSGLRKGKKEFRVTNDWLGLLGLSGRTVRRGLLQLERAGLVQRLGRAGASGKAREIQIRLIPDIAPANSEEGT